jgi:hypothetical protein
VIALIYSKILPFIALLFAIIGVVFPLVIRRDVISWGEDNPSIVALGSYGDWFGGTSAPLLGIAGLLMITAAYYAQMEELKLTREEMEKTRNEFHQQNFTMCKQTFENSFFQLLKFQREVTSDLIFANHHGAASAEFAVKRFFFDFLRVIPTNLKSNGNPQTIISYAIETFYKFNLENQHVFGHYFRSFHHVVKFIDDQQHLEETEKKQYMSIVRSILSEKELQFLYLNAYYGVGYNKFLPLAIKYDLFHNVSWYEFEELLKNPDTVLLAAEQKGYSWENP